MKLSRRALHPELAALVAVAGVLDLWRLGQNGWANSFYSAAVRSMSSSWHDFLYGSFDPGGVMTVDKPPLALWVQTLSVKVFGFRPLSILAPEALMGVAATVLVYDLTRRCFGRAAGFVAGLALATTPITVAISRHNNPDALLILCCTAALWCTVRALERRRTLWLALAGACVGLGFETKMAVALMVVPGIAAAWIWVAPSGRAAAVRQLLTAGAAALAVGAAWPLVTALTPAGARPWISGTSDNGVGSLILGYNGVGRLAGQAGGPSSLPRPQGSGGLFGGTPGPLRLLDSSLGGQAGWLVGVALVGAVAILAAGGVRRDVRGGWLLAVGGAFVTTAVAFSWARGIFHPYYVSLLAPFTAALVGAGVVEVARSGRAARLLAPALVVAGAATEAVVIRHNPEGLRWLIPLLVAVGLAVATALAVAGRARLRIALIAMAMAGLLVAPSTWAVQTLGHPTSATFPAGGPAGADTVGSTGLVLVTTRRAEARHVRRIRERYALDALELRAARRYVSRHGGGTIGVRSQKQAAPTIIASDAAVAGLGGFSGAESEMTVSWFARAVASGRIRWVLFNGRPRVRPGKRIGATRVLRAVAAGCPRIPQAAYAGHRRVPHGALYDCSGRAAALIRTSRSVGRLASI